MSKLERAVEALIYAEKKLGFFLRTSLLRSLKRLPFPVCDKTQKELYRELIDLGLVEGSKYFKYVDDESDDKPTDPVMVDEVTKLGCKLIKLSEGKKLWKNQDAKLWEKVKKGDTSGIPDDNLKKAVEHLLK